MHIRSLRRLCAVALLLAVSTGHALADDHWPRFRGPNGTGVSDAKTIPTTISDKDVRWKTKLPGVGHSSPVVWGDKVFVTSGDADTGAQRVHALAVETGMVLWTKQYASQTFRMHRFNAYAAASCAVDADRVYFVLTSKTDRQLIALTHAGDEVWRYPLGAYEAKHGSGTSPIVHNGFVVMANDQIGKGFLVAVDAATGKEKWKIARPAGNAAYATPCLMGEGDDAAFIVASQEAGMAAIEPATGKVKWQLNDGLFPKRVVASPVIADGKVVISCGQGGGGEFLVSVAPGSKDAKPRVAWKLPRAAPYVPTSVLANGLLFVISDGGVGTCLDPADGKIKWQQRIGGNGYFASLVAVNGVVYAVGRDGKIVTYRAAAEFERIGSGDLGEEAYATPAIAHGRMFLRSVSHVTCIGGRPVASR